MQKRDGGRGLKNNEETRTAAKQVLIILSIEYRPNREKDGEVEISYVDLKLSTVLFRAVFTNETACGTI